MPVDREQEAEMLQFQSTVAAAADVSSFAQPARCAQCGDWIVAPLMSEFVAGGEIRHHWVCESCGEVSCTAVALAAE